MAVSLSMFSVKGRSEDLILAVMLYSEQSCSVSNS